MENKTIYIMLSYTGTILSKIVKVATNREFSHVSIGLDLYLDELYSFGRVNPKNPFSGGFVKEELNSGVYADFDTTECTIYSINVSEEKYDKLKYYLHSFYKKKEEYGYNLFGLFGMVFNKPINRENKYFCSQFVASALKYADIYDFKKDPGLVYPHDFSEIPNINHIYTGKLNLYKAYLYNSQEQNKFFKFQDKILTNA